MARYAIPARPSLKKQKEMDEELKKKQSKEKRKTNPKRTKLRGLPPFGGNVRYPPPGWVGTEEEHHPTVVKGLESLSKKGPIQDMAF